MKKEITQVVIGAFAVAQCVVSVSAAQSQTPQVPAETPTQTPLTSAPSDPPDHPTTAPQVKPDPRMYLSNARSLIEKVSDDTLNSDGRKKLAALRTNFQSLVTAYEGQSSATPGENWKMRFDEVERNFVSILGAGAATEVRSTTAVGSPVEITVPGTTGSQLGLGVAIVENGVKNLDPYTRTQLDLARRNVEQFFDGATRTSQTQ